MHFRAFVLSLPVFVCLAHVGPSFAVDSSCGFLFKEKNKLFSDNGQPAPLEDEQLLVRGSSGWQRFGSLTELGIQSARDVDFAFVIKVPEGMVRSGVLVVKTNRPVTDADPEKLRNRVRLVRRNIVPDAGCPLSASSPNFEASISTQSYRDYHDFPARGTTALRERAEDIVEPEPDKPIENQFAALKAFHFEYRSDRKHRCIRTDNNESDDFPTDGNSNRAQFSFDRTVVAGGSYGFHRLFFWVPASPFEGATEHRVLVTKYTTQQGLACVRFTVPLKSANYTFRINDLESHTSESPNRRKAERYLPPAN